MLKPQVEVAQSPATYEQAAIRPREAELRTIMFTSVFPLEFEDGIALFNTFYGVRIDQDLHLQLFISCSRSGIPHRYDEYSPQDQDPL